MSILEEAKKIQEELVEHRRYIHKNAEVGLDLPVTVAYVMEELTKLGYSPKMCGKGVVALAGNGNGKTYMLRADMDALPIEETEETPYISKTGNMHACGHDMHATMLLGAAKLLKAHESEIEGTVKLMFQPAEESLLGANNMIEAGIMENPKVDAASMMHVFIGGEEPSGTVAIQGSGVTASAADWFQIHIQGKGSHGAIPSDGVDPINVAARIFTGIQEIHARELAGGQNLALTIGEFKAGTQSNIVPDTAYMAGTMRTTDEEVRKFCKKRLVEISEGMAATYRAKAEVKYITECPNFISDKAISDLLKEVSTELLGEEKIYDMTGKRGQFMNGSEDFAFVSHMVPTSFVALFAGGKNEGYTNGLHHPKARFNEDVLYIGAAIHTETALRWLARNK